MDTHGRSNVGTDWTFDHGKMAAYGGVLVAVTRTPAVRGIYFSSNYGQTFTFLPSSPASVVWEGVSCDTSCNRITAAGGQVYGSSDAGTWTQLTTGMQRDYIGPSMNADGTRVLVGQNGGQLALCLERFAPYPTTAPTRSPSVEPSLAPTAIVSTIVPTLWTARDPAHNSTHPVPHLPTHEHANGHADAVPGKDLSEGTEDGTGVGWEDGATVGCIEGCAVGKEVGRRWVVPWAGRTADYLSVWGDRMAGGDASSVADQLQNVFHLTASRDCFVAFVGDAGIVMWGYGPYGGDVSGVASQLAEGIVYVAHTGTALAAVKADGSVVAWGQAGHGGGPSAAVEALLTSGVHTVCANDVAFSAIKTDGSVVAWGHEVSVPVGSEGVQFTSAAFQQPVTCALSCMAGALTPL